jgi:lysophospholipase L1-like esterase
MEKVKGYIFPEADRYKGGKGVAMVAIMSVCKEPVRMNQSEPEKSKFVSVMLINNRYAIVVVAVMASLLAGCGTDGLNPVSVTLSDTTITIGSLALPDSAVLARSIVSTGNLYRMASFIDKARSGSSLKIGCIGGSITFGTAASSDGARYINRLQDFLQRAFSKSTFSVVDAGIGATNSRFGCSRVQDDLLVQNPDLIIIEFAVNDDPGDSVLTIQSIEGLVRQCLKYGSAPVIMLFTMNNAGDTVISHWHAIIGNHYCLPVISYRNAMWPFIADGQMLWSLISADNVHPNDNGHLIIGYLLYSFIKNVCTKIDTSQPVSLPMPTPFSTDLYEFAGLHSSIAGTPIAVSSNSGWNPVSKEFSRIGYTSSKNGDSIVFQTTLDEVTIGYHYWQNLSGRIQVKLDGRILDTISNYFADDWGPGFLKLYQVYKQGGNAARTISITNLDNSLFDMQYILYAR